MSRLLKKFRLNCPTCGTSRKQIFISHKRGVICGCGQNLSTPPCTHCKAPGHHPHQLNSGRWACTECKKKFTYPEAKVRRSRKARNARNAQKGANAKPKRRVTAPAKQMCYEPELLLVEMLVQKDQDSISSIQQKCAMSENPSSAQNLISAQGRIASDMNTEASDVTPRIPEFSAPFVGAAATYCGMNGSSSVRNGHDYDTQIYCSLNKFSFSNISSYYWMPPQRPMDLDGKPTSVLSCTIH